MTIARLNKLQLTEKLGDRIADFALIQNATSMICSRTLPVPVQYVPTEDNLPVPGHPTTAN